MEISRLQLVIFAGVVQWPTRLAASQSHGPQDVVHAGRLGSLTTALRALESASSPLAFAAESFAGKGSPWAAPDTHVRHDADNNSEDASASGSSNSSSLETGEQEGGGGDGGEGEDEAAGGDDVRIIKRQHHHGEAAVEEEAVAGRHFFPWLSSFYYLLPTRPSPLTSLTQSSPSDQWLLEEEEVEGDFRRLWVWLRREGTNGTAGNETTNGPEGTNGTAGNETSTGGGQEGGVQEGGGQEGGGGDTPDDNDGCGVEECIPTNSIVSVALPYSAATFTPELQTKFTIAVAKVAGVKQAKVTITAIAASGASRRQATITVTFVVTAPSKLAATNVTLALRNKLNTELVPLGVEPISAIWVHAENFCAGAIQREACKNAEYLPRCVWDSNCGCFDKRCGNCPQGPEALLCSFECADTSYPRLVCEDSVEAPECRCLPPDGTIPGGSPPLVPPLSTPTSLLPGGSTGTAVALITNVTVVNVKEQNTKEQNTSVKEENAVVSALKSVCGECVKTVCDATENWGWTCGDWLILAASCAVIGIVACCCCCCCCCFYRRRLQLLLCCSPCLQRCCPGGDPDSYENERKVAAAIKIQKRLRGILARRKTAEIFVGKMQKQELHAAVSEYLVTEVQARLQPGASAASLRSRSRTPEHADEENEHADEENETGNGNTFNRASIEQWLVRNPTSPLTRSPLCAAKLQPNRSLAESTLNPLLERKQDEAVVCGAAQAVTVRIVLNMHISESGEDGTYERAKFKIRLLRELAQASGVQKKFLDVKLISAGSIIVDVDICADPNLDADSHCPRNVATDLERQAQDEQSQLRSGTLMARLVSISIVEPSRREAILHQLLQEQQQVAPIIATAAAAAESHQRHSTRAPRQSSAKALARSRSLSLSLWPATQSTIETNGKSAQRRSKGSQSRTVRTSVIQDTEPEPIRLLPNKEIFARRLQALREAKKREEGAMNHDSDDSASLPPKIQQVQIVQAPETVPEGERRAKIPSPAGNSKDMSSAVADTQLLSLDVLESQETHSTIVGSEKRASTSALMAPSDATHKLRVTRCVTLEKRVSHSGIKASPSEKSTLTSPTNISLGDRKQLTASDARTPRKRVKGKVGHEESLSPRLGASTNLFEEFDLTDDMVVLAENGIKCQQDFSYLDDNVIQEMKYLSPITRAKLRKIVMSLDNTAATPTNPSPTGQLPSPYVEDNGGPILHSPTSLRQYVAPSPLTSSLYQFEPRRSSAFYQDGALYQSTAPSTYTSVNPYFDGLFNLNPPSLNGQPQGAISAISAAAAATATAAATAAVMTMTQQEYWRVFKQLAGQKNVHLRLEDQKSLGGEDTEEEDHNRSGAPLDIEAGRGGGKPSSPPSWGSPGVITPGRQGENVISFDASSTVNRGELPLTSLSRRGKGREQVSASTSISGEHIRGQVFIQESDLEVLENTILSAIERERARVY